MWQNFKLCEIHKHLSEEKKHLLKFTIKRAKIRLFSNFFCANINSERWQSDNYISLKEKYKEDSGVLYQIKEGGKEIGYYLIPNISEIYYQVGFLLLKSYT